MSKVFKGIGKAIKGIVNGVKKVYHKVVESKIGKALLIGATIYLGGAALGMWSSPFQSINGALRAGAAASGGTAAPSAAATHLTGNAAASNAAAAASMPTGIETLTVTGAAPAAGGGAAAAIAPAAMAIPTRPTQLPAETVSPQPASQTEMMANLGQSTETPGILNRLLSGASQRLRDTAGFVDKHPYATAMMLNAAGNMLTPDAVDVMQMQQAQEEKDRRRREANLDVRNINLGVSPSNRPLNYTDGTPVYGSGGILNRNVPGRG